MDQAALLAELNIRLGDTDNFTFTSDEKTSALTEAINDDYTLSPRWISTLTYSVGTYQYAIPATIDVIQDIYIRPDNSQDNPEKISANLWEVVGSNIQFKGIESVPDGYTLYLKGSYKYTTSDTITETNVQEYVLNLAQRHCLKMLGVKKALRFLKNDTSMSEVVAIKRELDQEVRNYRKRMPTAWEAA